MIVRINNDLTIDLMTEACGERYEDVLGGIEIELIDDMPIPFEGAELMLKMKQSPHVKDTAAVPLHPAASAAYRAAVAPCCSDILTPGN
jgi:hypothetical protein